MDWRTSSPLLWQKTLALNTQLSRRPVRLPKRPICSVFILRVLCLISSWQERCVRAMLTRRRSGDDCQTVGWKEYDQRVSLLGPSDGPSARPHVRLVWFLYVNFQIRFWKFSAHGLILHFVVWCLNSTSSTSWRCFFARITVQSRCLTN